MQQAIVNVCPELGDDNRSVIQSEDVSLDSILQQIQLSMITSIENYLFYDERSTLHAYPTIARQAI